MSYYISIVLYRVLTSSTQTLDVYCNVNSEAVFNENGVKI